nr:unnamed protein product [Callosobruchus chinensis]
MGLNICRSDEVIIESRDMYSRQERVKDKSDSSFMLNKYIECHNSEKSVWVNSIFQEREGAGVIYETCDAILKCFNEKHMPFPTTEMLEKSANDYENLWNFPNCVASIDGKHHMETGSFPFPQPRQIPRSTMTLPYVILGDQGYPLKKYLLRPYPTGTAERPRETEIYNYRLSRARRTVECAFGILVSKWRCLKTELQVEPHHVDKLVLTACLLHNILIDKEGLDEGSAGRQLKMRNTSYSIVLPCAEEELFGSCPGGGMTDYANTGTYINKAEKMQSLSVVVKENLPFNGVIPNTALEAVAMKLSFLIRII